MSWDLKAFEQVQAVDPKWYRNMKWVLRINGPMVILLTLFMMFGTLMEFNQKEYPIWKFLLIEITNLLLCIVSVRWFVWSIKRG